MNRNQDKMTRLNRRSRFASDALIFTVLILTSSCTILSQKKQTELTKTLWSYRSAIRWGQYADALGFQKDPQKDFDYFSVRDVKVTSYRVRDKAFSKDGDHLDQTVEIRYIREPGVVEKAIFDKQNWFYDEETEGWILEGELPHFQ